MQAIFYLINKKSSFLPSSDIFNLSVIKKIIDSIFFFDFAKKNVMSKEYGISPNKIIKSWDHKVSRVCLHIISLDGNKWEIKIFTRNGEWTFTGDSYQDVSKQANRAGRNKIYFKEQGLIDPLKGREIKRIRKAIKRTQAEFCELLRSLGLDISQSYLSELENGMYGSTNEILEQIKSFNLEEYYGR